jgi:hypothetical protein
MAIWSHVDLGFRKSSHRILFPVGGGVRHLHARAVFGSWTQAAPVSLPRQLRIQLTVKRVVNCPEDGHRQVRTRLAIRYPSEHCPPC